MSALALPAQQASPNLRSPADGHWKPRATAQGWAAGWMMPHAARRAPFVLPASVPTGADATPIKGRAAGLALAKADLAWRRRYAHKHVALTTLHASEDLKSTSH